MLKELKNIVLVCYLFSDKPVLNNSLDHNVSTANSLLPHNNTFSTISPNTELLNSPETATHNTPPSKCSSHT